VVLLDGAVEGPPGCPCGSEHFRSGGTWLDLTLLDFWRWSESDLLAAPTRARLVEFVVAALLGVRTPKPRSDRSPDLLTADGTAVRVKSASAVTVEGRRDPGKVHFSPLPWRAPRRGPSVPATVPRSRAHVFVVIGNAEPADVNPLDLDQWRFYVPSTARLEEKMKRQRALSLAVLAGLCGGPVAPGGLAEAVRLAARG
jgi:hypothetical protein